MGRACAGEEVRMLRARLGEGFHVAGARQGLCARLRNQQGLQPHALLDLEGEEFVGRLLGGECAGRAGAGAGQGFKDAPIIAELLGDARLHQERGLERRAGIVELQGGDLRPQRRTGLDFLPVAQTVGKWVPVVDTPEHGQAVYWPMADGAIYRVNITAQGQLLPDEVNEAAAEAVATWGTSRNPEGAPQ